MKKNWNIAALALLTVAGMANAHYTAGTLSVKAGQTLQAGQSLDVTWNVTEGHGGKIQNISYSKDGGTNWVAVGTLPASPNNPNTFKWTVPSEATTKGRFRVCFSAASPAKSCADLNKDQVSEDPYTLVGGDFIITSANGIAVSQVLSGETSIGFNPETRTVNVSFALTESRNVSLEAFDSQGRLVATLLNGKQASGAHKLSLSSKNLDGATGTLMFKLKAGDQIHTQTWNAVR